MLDGAFLSPSPCPRLQELHRLRWAKHSYDWSLYLSCLTAQNKFCPGSHEGLIRETWPVVGKAPLRADQGDLSTRCPWDQKGSRAIGLLGRSPQKKKPVVCFFVGSVVCLPCFFSKWTALPPQKKRRKANKAPTAKRLGSGASQKYTGTPLPFDMHTPAHSLTSTSGSQEVRPCRVRRAVYCQGPRGQEDHWQAFRGSSCQLV